MNDTVLENIKRKNLEQHKIEEIFALCEKENVPVYTELILGLPGESVESWKESVYKIMRAGNHTGINIFMVQILENTEMNHLQKRLWRIETVPVYDYMVGNWNDNIPEESIDVVVSTKDISREEMIDTMAWNVIIQTFHINGFGTYIARYLEKAHGIDYKVFYDTLMQALEQDPWLWDRYLAIKDYIRKWFQDGRINHPPIGSVEIAGINLLHLMTMYIYKENKVDHVIDFLGRFIRDNFSVPNDVLDQLLEFQSSFVIQHKDLGSLPAIREFDYDFLGFILEGSQIQTKCKYVFDTDEEKTMSYDRFLENIFFGRKRNFGKANVVKS